jgi:hypothetical protein
MDQRNGSIQTNDLAYLVDSDSGELFIAVFAISTAQAFCVAL